MWYATMWMGATRDDQLSATIEGWFTEGWQNEAYQRLEQEMPHVVDLEERLRICRAGDRILVEEAPTILLMYVRMGFLLKPWVTRFPLGAPGGAPWRDVVIEPH
jgi:hypothetical protein